MLKFFKKRSNSLKEKPPENYDITQYYDIGKEIGKGAFSIVKEATHKQSGKKYAIKTVNKKFINEKDLKLLGREIDIMKKLEHPNIVNLFEVVEFEDELHIIMELVSGGELFDHIVERGSYSEKDASQIVKQLCEAVSFMHKNGVAHRDLKPQNLLCTPDGMTIKIADFGLSKIYGKGEALVTACGTPDYVAPEILLCKPYNNSVDIWSVGIITYILLCGFTPFFAETHKELFDMILHSPFEFPSPEWDDISEEAKDFVSHLLEKDPEKRYTAEQALQHPWLTGKAKSNDFKRMNSFKTLLTEYNTKRRLNSQGESKSDDTILSEGLKKKNTSE